MVDQLQEKLIKLSDEIRELISKASDLKSLDEIRINSLGKKGSVTSHLKNLRDYDNDAKRQIGSLVNKIKININD